MHLPLYNSALLFDDLANQIPQNKTEVCHCKMTWRFVVETCQNTERLKRYEKNIKKNGLVVGQQISTHYLLSTQYCKVGETV